MLQPETEAFEIQKEAAQALLEVLVIIRGQLQCCGSDPRIRG